MKLDRLLFTLALVSQLLPAYCEHPADSWVLRGDSYRPATRHSPAVRISG